MLKHRCHSNPRAVIGLLQRYLLILACLLPGSRAVATERSTPEPSGVDRPNIIFIFTDDHSPRAISAYGSKLNTTPNIDQLAAEGMRFDHCLVTNAICGPSRACILTGQYSHRNGFYRNGNRFDGKQNNVAKILQSGGYQTAVIGKWHLSSDPTGFDHWEILYGQGPYYNPKMKTAGGDHKYTGYTTDIITDLALDFLKTQTTGDQPFLLMCQHKAPHRNWQPGPDHLALYDDVTIPEPETLFDDYANRASPARNQEMTVAEHLSPFDLKLVPPKNLTADQLETWNTAYGPKNEAYLAAELQGVDRIRWQYQRYIKDYLRCIASVDDNIGRLLRYLDESGLAENTIVVYSSDQGWYLGEHGWYDKRWMYEESLTMPLIVRWPDVVAAGTVNEDLVSNVDFAETFLDAAGLRSRIPAEMQGRSLVPLLKGQTPNDWRQTFYYHYYEFPGAHNVARHCGVRSQRYKLIYYYQLDEWEFFDLQTDPNELVSVYDHPEYAALVNNHKAELTRLQNELGMSDPYGAIPGDPEPQTSVESP